MAEMERGALPGCPNSKRKAAEAALDDGLSDANNDVAALAPAPAPAAAEIEASSQEQQEEAAPRQPTKRVMSQEWINSILSSEIKPLPLNKRLLRNPELAAVFESHEKSRSWFPKYQNWIRRELETKGYVEVPDDYEEMVQLRQAVYDAAFYGREEEEKEAMAKLEAMRLRHLNNSSNL